MDFQQLLAKMAQLDQPVGEARVEECGDMMPSVMPQTGMFNKPDTPPPSMSVNINAQGLDNIEDLLKLVAKVNPDMPHTDAPDDMGGPDMLSIKTSPVQTLPGIDDGSDHGHDDMDDSEDEMFDPEKMKDGDMMGSGAGDINKDGEEQEDEAWGNGLAGSDDTEVFGMDKAVPNGNDLNKKKMTFPKVAGGDNPMLTVRVESTDLRSQIRADLQRRLNEAKSK